MCKEDIARQRCRDPLPAVQHRSVYSNKHLYTRYNESEYNFYLRRSGGRPNRQPNRRHLLTSYGEFKGGATPDAESHLMRQLVQHAHVRHGFVRYLHKSAWLPGSVSAFTAPRGATRTRQPWASAWRVPLLPHPCENASYKW